MKTEVWFLLRLIGAKLYTLIRRNGARRFSCGDSGTRSWDTETTSQCK
ncbi:unnamed protein product [Brassica rapa subsp. narinosa]